MRQRLTVSDEEIAKARTELEDLRIECRIAVRQMTNKAAEVRILEERKRRLERNERLLPNSGRSRG